MRANECSSALESSVMETGFFFFPRCWPTTGSSLRGGGRGGDFARAGPSGTEANEE